MLSAYGTVWYFYVGIYTLGCYKGNSHLEFLTAYPVSPDVMPYRKAMILRKLLRTDCNTTQQT